MSSVVFVLNRFRTRTCTWSSLSSTHDFLFAGTVAPILSRNDHSKVTANRTLKARPPLKQSRRIPAQDGRPPLPTTVTIPPLPALSARYCPFLSLAERMAQPRKPAVRHFYKRFEGWGELRATPVPAAKESPELKWVWLSDIFKKARVVW
jgi:hypothetical protein